ncbi:MAG: ABC transporter ATP-binding protein [Lachnospiraceae bacterium]|nr:ABC transporter ATP-binding protein [Lachnospiraceae bacterium]
MNENLLQIKDLSVRYEDCDVEDLQVMDVSIGMNPGEILCIVGESGSGKSTLIKAVHGMGSTSIEKGSISFKGSDMAALSKSDRRNIMGPELGLIPQNPYSSFNPIRRYEVQLREALTAHRMEYNKNKVLEVFDKIGLRDGERILKCRPYELSGGMNQRIAIAVAFLFEPDLLMCDEPTSALDVTTAGMVVDELVKMKEEQNTAILMVTHHLGIAARMADNIGIMKEGRIIEYGPAREIFKNPKEEYSKKLIEDVPRLRR